MTHSFRPAAIAAIALMTLSACVALPNDDDQEVVYVTSTRMPAEGDAAEDSDARDGSDGAPSTPADEPPASPDPTTATASPAPTQFGGTWAETRSFQTGMSSLGFTNGKTGSKKMVCELGGAGGTLPADVLCIGEVTAQSDPPASCTMGWIPAAAALHGSRVELGACMGGIPWANGREPSKVLPVGQRLVSGVHTCVATATGAACAHDDGHGFRIDDGVATEFSSIPEELG